MIKERRAGGALAVALVAALVPALAQGQITRQETVTQASTASPNLLPSIQGGTNQTYVLFVGALGTTTVSAVSGGGLTWTLQKNQCGANSAASSRVWTAQGSPAGPFQVQVTYNNGNLAAVLSRYSGVGTVVGAAGENTNGPEGNCANSPQNANARLTLTSLAANAVHTIGVGPADRTVTAFKAGYALVGSRVAGAGGARQGSFVYDRTFAAPTTDQFTATLSGNERWATAGVVLLPIYGANVTPDGSQNLLLLPGGPNYSVTFSVTNSGSNTDGFDLLASRTGTAVTIVSVKGVAGDSTRITNVVAGATQTITVVYSIGNVAAGTIDTVRLRARSVTSAVAFDDGSGDLAVVRPNIAVAKSVAPPGTPLPASDLTYTITLTNDGSEAAVSVVHVDSLPAQIGFKVGSVITTLPPGVSGIASYSNTGAASWIYVPVSGGCSAPAGYDYCVTHIRLVLNNPLSQTGPNNVVQLQFVARVR